MYLKKMITHDCENHYTNERIFLCSLQIYLNYYLLNFDYDFNMKYTRPVRQVWHKNVAI